MPVSSAESVTFRPRKIRRLSWALAPVVAVCFVVLGTLLSGSTGGDDDAVFQPSDQAAMMVLGLFIAAGVLVIGRPKVVADAEHVRIQNIIGGYDLPWGVVRSVRFERGSPWLTLELEDDEVVAVMAIQATDKEHAVEGARALRALHAAHRADHAAPST